MTWDPTETWDEGIAKAAFERGVVSHQLALKRCPYQAGSIQEVFWHEGRDHMWREETQPWLR